MTASSDWRHSISRSVGRSKCTDAKANGDPSKYIAGISVAEAHQVAATILALEADKAALVEALEYVISDFELPLMALDAIGNTLAKHGSK